MPESKHTEGSSAPEDFRRSRSARLICSQTAFLRNTGRAFRARTTLWSVNLLRAKQTSSQAASLVRTLAQVGAAPDLPANVQDSGGRWLRAIRLVRPIYAIVENVADLLARGMDEVLGDLAAFGYDAEWNCIQACDVGLPQGRDRVWVVAYPHGGGCEASAQRDCARPRFELRPDHDGLALAQHRARRDAFTEIRGMDDGLPDGLDRLRSLGNAVVPQIPELIGRAILQAHGLKSDSVTESKRG